MTDIPGAREAVRATGMGLLVAANDPKALADGIVAVINDQHRYRQSWNNAIHVFDRERSIDEYEDLMLAMVQKAAIRVEK